MNLRGRGEGGGSEILARDHLLVGRPMPTQDDFRRTGMSEFLGGEGLRYLAHLSLSKVQRAWMRSTNVPVSLDRGEEGS